MRRVHDAQARRAARAHGEGKSRNARSSERAVRRTPFRLVHKLVEPDSPAPGEAMIVSRLQGAEGELKALLTVARHDELSSALQAFDAAVHRFADMEDAAGGCLCWATPAPDLSEHPLWAEVAAYNEYYRTSSLRFVASPSDDYPTEVIISGEATEIRRRAGSGDSNASGGVLAAPSGEGRDATADDTQGLVDAADVHVGLLPPPVVAATPLVQDEAAPAPDVAPASDEDGTAAAVGVAQQPVPLTGSQAEGEGVPLTRNANSDAQPQSQGGEVSDGDSSGDNGEGSDPADAVAAQEADGHKDDEQGDGMPDSADPDAGPGALGAEDDSGDAMGDALPVAGTKEERAAAWLAANKKRAEAAAAAAEAARQAKLDAMDEEERAAFLSEEKLEAERKARQDRIVKRQLGAYVKSNKQRLRKPKGRRGRGRGKGR